MNKKIRIIPLRKELLEENGIFNTVKVLRKWKYTGVYPQIFLKFGGRIHIDLEEWDKIIEEAKRERDERVAMFNELRGL